MKQADLNRYRDALLAMRARLRGDVNTLTSKALSGSGGSGDMRSPTHMAELGTDAWEQAFSLRFAQNDQETLEEIDAALDRIEDGSFGLCQDCVAWGKPASKCAIARTRLNAIPYARNCIECERRREEMV